MNEIEEKVLELAEIYNKPDEFINILNSRLLELSSDIKGDVFLQVGIILQSKYIFLALKCWNYALQYLINIDDKLGELECYARLGASYGILEDFTKAIEYFNKALKIAIEIEDKAKESECNENIGIAYSALEDFTKAIEYFNKALKIAIEIEDKEAESKSYINIGVSYNNLCDLTKAIECFNKALKIAIEIEDKETESDCYTSLGEIYSCLGYFRKAIGYTEKALEIAKNNGDMPAESMCYISLGRDHDKLGYFRKAIGYTEKALEIAKNIGDKDAESTCYINLGDIYKSIGNSIMAIEYVEKSLKIAKYIGDKAMESECYKNLCGAYNSLEGDFSWDKIPGNDNKILIEILFQNFGLNWLWLKTLQIENDGETINIYTKKNSISLRLNEATVNIRIDDNDITEEFIAKTINGKLIIYGYFNKAIEYAEKSLEFAKNIEDRFSESMCYIHLGATYQTIRDFKKAIEYYERSLKIVQDIGAKAMESECCVNIGAAHQGIGNFKKAIEYYEKSSKIAKEIGNIDCEMIIALNLGKAYYKEDKLQHAYNYYKYSIELSDNISGRLVEDTHKIWFYSAISEIYQHIVPLCFKLRKDTEAFKYTERSKSRAFLELLSGTEIKPSIKVTSELNSLLDDEENYLAKLQEIQTRDIRNTSSIKQGEIATISKKLNEIYYNIEKFDPEYVSIRQSRPIHLNDIQEILSSKKNSVLVEYFVTNDQTFIFVITPRGFYIKTIPLSSDKLGKYVEIYWEEVVDGEGIGDTWLHLSTDIIEPISEYLYDKDTIYFVPYGLLHYIPIHALELNGEPIIKRHTVSYLPSASILKIYKNKGTGKLKTLASFGTIFNDEAENIAKIFSTKPFLDASKSNVLDNMNKDILHFSCHGYFDDIDPLSSGVILHDGVLAAREIFKLKLNTELVTLSACQTGINKRIRGDELVGLTRSFLYAGARSIIVSLWSVNSSSTQELMIEFYRLLKNGKGKATALQEAQNRIMEKEEYAHPYFWAPFILVGD